MPQKDKIHDAVKNALIKDGWTVTHDHYRIKYGEEKVFIDIATEKILAAEKEGQQIAVEIKSFIGKSPITDISEALGQHNLYITILEEVEPQRKLYLAISKPTYDELRNVKAFMSVVKRFQVALIIVKIPTEEIFEWIE